MKYEMLWDWSYWARPATFVVATSSGTFKGWEIGPLQVRWRIA